jgi:hypothetical protein
MCCLLVQIMVVLRVYIKTVLFLDVFVDSFTAGKNAAQKNKF